MRYNPGSLKEPWSKMFCRAGQGPVIKSIDINLKKMYWAWVRVVLVPTGISTAGRHVSNPERTERKRGFIPNISRGPQSQGTESYLGS